MLKCIFWCIKLLSKRTYVIKGFCNYHQTRFIHFNVGEGAYSSVYKVQRHVDGQIYALKKVKMNNLS